MVVIRAAIASLLVLTSACTVGEVPPAGSGSTPDASTPTQTADASPTDSGGGAQTPDQTFAAQVTPQVQPCVGCHGGGQKPNLTSATLLEAQYKVKPGATNPLVNHGTHAGAASTLNNTQKNAIVAWINSQP
jgi:mono/diheme cytochrome c family protein